MRSPLWGVWVRCGAVRGVDVASGGVGAPCHQSERVPETFETLFETFETFEIAEVVA